VRTGDRLAATVALLSHNTLFHRVVTRSWSIWLRRVRDELRARRHAVHGGRRVSECYIIEEGQAVVTIGRKGVATVGEHDVVGERLRIFC